MCRITGTNTLIAVVIMCRTRESVHCYLSFWMSILGDCNAPTGDMYYRAYLKGTVVQHKKQLYLID
jgi:hypothetical protein